MQETKVTLVYFGLSLFVFLALIPWILDIEHGLISIKAFGIYGGIVIAFLGGFIWGWDDQTNSSFNLWYAIGFSLMGLSTALLAHTYIALSLILIVFREFFSIIPIVKHNSRIKLFSKRFWVIITF